MAKKEKERRYRKRRGGIAYTILAVLLIAASVVAACTVFFRVEEVTVEGNERYSQEQILSVASVEMGANMILTPGSRLPSGSTAPCPMWTMEVQKRFPTTLKMVITESQPVAVITGAASAWIVDAKGKLLEQADETQAQEYTKVTGLELLEPEQGAQAQTTPENQAQLDGLTAMTTALASCGLMEGMTSIDVSSKTEIVMVYDGRLTVKVLNNVDFDRKLKALKQVIAVIGEEGRGTINMKGQDKIIWSKEN
ncbi:MAG: cell division protein FtsQ/DivIB [Evtepia gabavorous]